MKKILLFLSILFVSWAFAQQTHTVKQGESPYGISKIYKLTLDELYKLNPSVKGGGLDIGQVLVVSKTGSNKPVRSAKPTTVTTSETAQILLQPKQTIYGLTKQYKISEADLRVLNPDLDEHMKIGDKITLPLSKIKKYGKDQPLATDEIVAGTNAEEKNFKETLDVDVPTYTTASYTDDYLIYTVQEGDTTFGIINKFGVTLDELIKLNPQLSSGLKAGMVLKIKKIVDSYVKRSGDALNVVLMLPFGYENGDSKYRELSLDFLMGAKLAIERNAKRGQKLNVKIIDAGNDTTFKNSLSQIDKNSTDLIIGPFFKKSVMEVLDHVKMNKIPVVAPFANSTELYSYENLIMIETDDQVFADKIAEEVVKAYSDQKIYIVAGSDKTYANSIKENLLKQSKNAVVQIVNSSSELVLDSNMMTGQSAPILAVLAVNSNSEGTAFATKLMEFSKETSGIKAFSMYYSSIFESKANDLGRVNLVYLMDRKINMDGSFEKEILSDYKSKYCRSPSKYAVIGFDVINDMLSRENKNGEIFKQISKTQTQLATKFDFVRTKNNGAYLNTGYRVVRLTQ